MTSYKIFLKYQNNKILLYNPGQKRDAVICINCLNNTYPLSIILRVFPLAILNLFILFLFSRFFTRSHIPQHRFPADYDKA